MEEQNIKIDFSYVDEFGQESRLIKTYTDAVFLDQSQFEVLVSEFKLFMLAAGYFQETVNTIQIIED